MWYAARLRFESVKSNPAAEELFEEDIFLLQADDEETAVNAACDIGYKQEHSYLNVYGETVTWRFIAVVDVKDLIADEIGHGTEIYYRFLDRDQLDPPYAWTRPDL